MAPLDYPEISEWIQNDLRLKTLPLAVKFLKSPDEFPGKTRRPSIAMKKRITICQAVTIARTYGWTVGLTRDDVICVPAMLAFGFNDADDPIKNLENLFCEIELAQDGNTAKRELSAMHLMEKPSFTAILLAPLAKGLVEADIRSRFIRTFSRNSLRSTSSWEKSWGFFRIHPEMRIRIYYEPDGNLSKRHAVFRG